VLLPERLPRSIAIERTSAVSYRNYVLARGRRRVASLRRGATGRSSFPWSTSCGMRCSSSL